MNEAKRQRPSRPAHAPPPPGWRPEYEVLQELESRGLLAIALWQGLRDVGLLARALPDGRAGMFRAPSPNVWIYGEAVSAAPELHDALTAFAAAVCTPESISAPGLAQICRGVYEWAEEQALMQTAAHFAEAAALVHPELPDHANLAARTCRRVAIHSRSGLWYQRGGVLAARAGDSSQKFLSRLGYGLLMYTLGRYDRAYRYMRKAARTALHTKQRRLAAEAEHGMLTICSELKLYQTGVQHAHYALRYYPTHHPFVPLLVHDVAYFLVTCGVYTPALPVLLESAKVVRPQENTLIWSTAARAAAGAGRMEVYASCRDASLQLLAQFPEHEAAAFRNLAFAGQLAEDWDAAEEAAARALAEAERRTMADVARTSRELLQAVRARQPGAAEVEPPAAEAVQRLVMLSHVRLRQWTGRKFGRPPGQTPPA